MIYLLGRIQTSQTGSLYKSKDSQAYSIKLYISDLKLWPNLESNLPVINQENSVNCGHLTIDYIIIFYSMTKFVPKNQDHITY